MWKGGGGSPPSAHPLHLQRSRAGIIMIMSTPNTDSLLSGSQSAFPTPIPCLAVLRVRSQRFSLLILITASENRQQQRKSTSRGDGTHLSSTSTTEQSRGASPEPCLYSDRGPGTLDSPSLTPRTSHQAHKPLFLPGKPKHQIQGHRDTQARSSPYKPDPDFNHPF